MSNYRNVCLGFSMGLQRLRLPRFDQMLDAGLVGGSNTPE